mmetsp:Transcript_36575/g.82235  ORF Transcript_36575/g.82235 Transcript_36575/m.82235 type:complete len:305 (+) Transcript_36575:332-1246(+)
MKSKTLSKLTTKNEPVSLTEDGKKWAHEYWDLYPFIDREQWDDFDRPYHKYAESDEQQLRFVLLFTKMLQKTRDVSTTSILNLLQGALQGEILRRFRDHVKDGRMENGDEPRTIKDVLSILFSFDAVKKVEQGEWAEVFGNIFNVIGSLTYEGGRGCDWLITAINDCLLNKLGLKVALAPVTDECVNRRHSITKYLGNKVTNHVKENAKELSRARFGFVLVLDTVVPLVGSPEYNKKITENNLEVVYINSPYTPNSRLPTNQTHAREAPFALTPCKPARKKKNSSTQAVERSAFFSKSVPDRYS